jgi:hypothetical protein
MRSRTRSIWFSNSVLWSSEEWMSRCSSARLFFRSSNSAEPRSHAMRTGAYAYKVLRLLLTTSLLRVSSTAPTLLCDIAIPAAVYRAPKLSAKRADGSSGRCHGRAPLFVDHNTGLRAPTLVPSQHTKNFTTHKKQGARPRKALPPSTSIATRPFPAASLGGAHG